jgi:hypothetical protein
MTHTISDADAKLLQTADVITWGCFTPSMIRQMHSTPEGAEVLRLIVRDNLQGAADKIANALWSNL